MANGGPGGTAPGGSGGEAPPEADGILVGLLEDTFLRCPGA